MSIRWDSRNKRWRFEFDRYVQGVRQRHSRLLPSGWSQAQADAYDRTEGGRLYAVASGTQQADPLIDAAVKLYLADKTHLKSFKATAENIAATAWAWQGKPMSALPGVARDIAAHREGVREGKVLSAATTRNRIACLKAACRWAWKAHALVANDPTPRMQLPEVRNERHVYASRADVGRLAWAADRRDVRAMILAAFYTGMRFGELRKLEVRDGALHLADTKNGDRRSIPMHPRLAPLLKHLPLTAPRSTLQRGWQRARAEVGLPHLHLHDLRHSAASEMINAKIDLYTVGAVLGHKDARSTKRYAHLTHGTLAEAVGKIGQKSPHKSDSAGKKKAAG
jgi:integrase